MICGDEHYLTSVHNLWQSKNNNDGQPRCSMAEAVQPAFYEKTRQVHKDLPARERLLGILAGTGLW